MCYIFIGTRGIVGGIVCAFWHYTLLGQLSSITHKYVVVLRRSNAPYRKFPLKIQHIVHNMMLTIIVPIDICSSDINYLCIYLHIQEWLDLRELDGWNCLPLSRPKSFVHNDMETATSGFPLPTDRQCGALIFFFIVNKLGCWRDNRCAGDMYYAMALMWHQSTCDANICYLLLWNKVSRPSILPAVMGYRTSDII